MRRTLGALLLCLACGPAKQPPTRELLHVSGKPYDMGLQHGQALKSKIHSFYTRMLTASLLPYLGREQADIETLLPVYGGDAYANGAFAHQLLVDSAKSIEMSLDDDVREEMKGIADGSGLAYEDVLLLNTFTDSTLAVRGISLAIRLSRAPRFDSFSVEGLDTDGLDNDGDGTNDQAGEGVIAPFNPIPTAQLVEVPAAPVFHVQVSDPDGIDPKSVRLEMDARVYTESSDEVALADRPDGGMEITFSPGDLGPPGVHTLVVSLSDAKVLTRPAPDHESVIRDEEIVFTTQGTGLEPWEVRRPRLDDGRTRAPSFALGLARSRVADGPMLAQNFALLDASSAHEHTLVLVHHPEHGPSYVTVGWAGVIYGFSGMNSNGVAYGCNPADSLSNSVVQSVVAQVGDLTKAKLTASGLPVGFATREVLNQATDAASALSVMQGEKHTYGWTCNFVDKSGGMQALELNSGTFGSAFAAYGPTDLDAHGQRLGSVSDDDLFVASAYQKNLDDAPMLTIAGQRVVPERFWSGFFYRSVRAGTELGRQVRDHMSVEDVETMIGEDHLVDHSDSMNAVVYEPAALKLHSAIGTEPANASPYEDFTLTEAAP
ncbi:MAG: carcinine hydrolase/isopenicillin-N N-acyltransferase family protein [Myxococcaceae bacterium]